MKKRQDCHVAIAPRNDITRNIFVIASEAKQSQADAGSPRIASLHCKGPTKPDLKAKTIKGPYASLLLPGWKYFPFDLAKSNPIALSLAPTTNNHRIVIFKKFPFFAIGKLDRLSPTPRKLKKTS